MGGVGVWVVGGHHGNIPIDNHWIHIHIHAPDTGISPHMVICVLEIHMGLVEHLSREWMIHVHMYS